jgi:hypothetical protein
MPINYDAVFQTVGQLTYRLHFPYLLEGFEKSMLVEEAGDLFTSDTREYTIKGLKRGNTTFDAHIKETGVDIQPGRVDAWFYDGGMETAIPLDLMANIKMRLEESTQNRIQLNLNGIRVN